MTKSGKFWAAVFAAVILLCAAVYIRISEREGVVAGIYSDGELVETVDLDGLKEPVELTVEYGGVKNVIRADENGIYVESASCPDQVCVEHGPLTGSGPIVCLPGHLVIKWLEGGESSPVDAVSG